MPRRRPPVVHGMVLVDKPAGMTSHDVVAVLRKHLGERRIGHAGTLDPDATGLLVVGVGSGTRLLRFATAASKTYQFVLHLGVETDTLDASGDVTVQHQPELVSQITPPMVSAAAAKFLGDSRQIPPMVSAIKVGGRRLHQLARAGIEVEREPRDITVTRFEVAPAASPAASGTSPAAYRCVVECSAGTYVRSLGADLGHALGIGAHISDLRRTASGNFSVEQAQPLEAMLAAAASTPATPDTKTPAASPADILQPISELVPEMSKVRLTAEQQERVSHGAWLDLPNLCGDGPWALLNQAGELLAVYETAEVAAATAAAATDAEAEIATDETTAASTTIRPVVVIVAPQHSTPTPTPPS